MINIILYIHSRNNHPKTSTPPSYGYQHPTIQYTKISRELLKRCPAGTYEAATVLSLWTKMRHANRERLFLELSTVTLRARAARNSRQIVSDDSLTNVRRFREWIR